MCYGNVRGRVFSVQYPEGGSWSDGVVQRDVPSRVRTSDLVIRPFDNSATELYQHFFLLTDKDQAEE